MRGSAVTFDQLRHVLEIEKTRSINEAANNLFLSQSALSLSLKTLESEIGQTIFIRNNKGVALTPFGKIFISYIKPINTQMMQLYNLCNKSIDRQQLSLKVTSQGFRFVSSILARLYQRYKSVGICLEEFDCASDDAIDVVSNRLVEIGVIRLWTCYKQLYTKQLESKSISFYPIARKKLCVLVGKNSPLYYLEKDSVSADELKDYPAVMHDYMAHGPYSDIMDRLGLNMSRNCLVTASRAVVYDMLNLTDAYFLSSDLQSVYRYFENENMPTNENRMLMLEGSDIMAEFGWIKHNSYQPSTIAREFISILEQALSL